MSERKPDAQGDLTRYPFPRLLFYLYKKQVLGELVLVYPGKFEGRIFLRQGLPVFSDLPSSSDVLGRVLLERGLISESQLNASLQQLSRGGPLQGQVLIQMGALDIAGLIEGLRIQLTRKLTRVFALSDAQFQLYTGEHGRGSRGEEAQVRVDPLRLIYHGVRSAFDKSRLDLELNKLTGMALRLKPEVANSLPRYGMGEDVQDLVALLKSEMTPFARILDRSTQGPLIPKMLLYCLWVTEALDACPDSSRPAAQPQHPAGPLTSQNPTVGRTQQRPLPRETAPEVAALAAEFTGGMAQQRSADGAARRSDGAAGEPPVITSAPARDAARSRAPALGDEGVYELPAAARGRAPTGPSQPATGRSRAPSAALRRVSSSPPQSPAPASPAPRTTRPSASHSKAPQPNPSARGSKPAAPAVERAGAATSRGAKGDAGAAAKHYQMVKKTHQRIKNENYYQILGLDQKATLEQIREAYFHLAKEFHPDRVASLGLNDVSHEAEEIFRFINDAHSTLTDREKRVAYNEALRGEDKKQAVQDALKAEFVFQKGLVLFRKKNFLEALKDFQEAYRLNSKEGEHLAYVGWCLFKDPRSDKTSLLPKIKEQLLKAIKISPNSATCHYFLGEVYLALGEERRAFTCFDKVLELQPGHLEATRHVRIIRMRKEKRRQQEKKKNGLLGRFRKK